MKIPKIGCAALGLVSLVLIVWQALDIRTAVLVSRPTGSITSGTLMGVAVGEDVEHAIARLRQLGFRDARSFPGGGSLYMGGRMRDPNNTGEEIQILPSQTVVVLRDRSWRHGGVELLVEDGRVVRITWGYGGPLMALIW